MARLADRLPHNADGNFFVDASCIDCDTCRQVAPDLFGDADGMSFVTRQPATPAETRRAQMALVACPTSSIGTAEKTPLGAAARAFPEPLTDGVYYCGYASADSYGASSYLVQRPTGNLLIDSPRAARPLLSRLDELGGVATMFLTHRDDVADHAVFHDRFGCRRVLHRADRSHDTAAVEQLLDGPDPIALGPGLTAIPVPGHTRGSTALLVDDHLLFSGDHLWWEPERGLHASRGVCWYSWPAQLRSLERLLDHRFDWVLPGHGRRWQAPSAAAMRAELERLLHRLRGSPPMRNGRSRGDRI